MSQSPYSGQSGAMTDYRPTDARSDDGVGDGGASAARDAHSAPTGSSVGHGGSEASLAQNPVYGAPVHADAPTGTIPALVTGSAARVAASAEAKTLTTDKPGSSNQTGQSSAAQSTPGGTTQTSRSRTSRARGPRRARLQLRNINPWTVLKFSCVLSIALFFVWLIVVGVLFGVLDAAGIIGKVNDTVIQLNGPGSNAPVTAGLVFGAAAIIGVINMILFIALSTIGAVVYNLCADLVGGIEVTLSER